MSTRPRGAAPLQPPAFSLQPPASGLLPCPADFTVLHEASTHWLVYKPPGLPVFPPHAQPGGDCVLSRLLIALPAQGQAFPLGFEGGIAHRLDTGTSGALVVARSPEALTALRARFTSGALRKVYHLLSGGRVPWTTHTVQTPLGHHPRRADRMVPQRGQHTPHRGRWYPATTELRALGGPRWEAVITTGVMHQIRAHAASVGLALAGDRTYGGARLPEGALPPGVPFALHHLGEPELGPPVAPPAWWATIEARL